MLLSASSRNPFHMPTPNMPNLFSGQQAAVAKGVCVDEKKNRIVSIRGRPISVPKSYAVQRLKNSASVFPNPIPYYIPKHFFKLRHLSFFTRLSTDLAQ
jgi:hypothetical protein